MVIVCLLTGYVSSYSIVDGGEYCVFYLKVWWLIDFESLGDLYQASMAEIGCYATRRCNAEVH
jgi:hypothetical protein